MGQCSAWNRVAILGLAACGSASSGPARLSFGDAAPTAYVDAGGGKVTKLGSADASSCAAGSADQTGCSCAENGETAACYTGPSATRGVGTCRDGVQTCASDGEFRVFGACMGETLPSSASACLPSFSADASCVVDSGGCAVVAALSGLRWELPCTSPATDSCDTDAAPRVVSTTLAGNPGTLYDVTLHFRGIVEPRPYAHAKSGGAVDMNGTGANGAAGFVSSSATPTAEDDLNVYELAISDPPQTYYLNNETSDVIDVFLIDYVATVPIRAGATVTLTASSEDGQELANQANVVVAGVAPYPAPYDGQFVEMDPTAVVVAP